MFLYDVKCYDVEKHKKYVGVGNELIFQNLEKLFATNANVWVRIPVILGVNNTVEEMRNIKQFLDKIGKPEKIELLPYHAMGEHKYSAIGRETTLFQTPSENEIMLLKSVFDG